MGVLVIPLFLAGALLAGAAYAAYQIIRQHRQKKRDEERRRQQEEDDRRRRSQSGKDQAPPERPVQPPILNRDQLIQKIVDVTQFTTQQKVLGERIVGTEDVPSQVPADDIMIRPMNGMGELPQVLPKAQMLPDDMFYAQAASGQLPVTEHIERVTLTEPLIGVSRKVLAVVQDISDSMNEQGRINWAIRLNQKLLDRCATENAEYIVLPFNGTPQESRRARNEPERRWLTENLAQILRSYDGTDIDAALNACLSLVEEGEFDETRILLVTDGTVGISPATIERLQKSGAFLHTVCINAQHDMLREVSQRYDELRD